MEFAGTFHGIVLCHALETSGLLPQNHRRLVMWACAPFCNYMHDLTTHPPEWLLSRPRGASRPRQDPPTSRYPGTDPTVLSALAACCCNKNDYGWNARGICELYFGIYRHHNINKPSGRWSSCDNTRATTDEKITQKQMQVNGMNFKKKSAKKRNKEK